jgi:hypothetical protein
VEAAEHRVADRAAHQGDLLTDRREPGTELVDDSGNDDGNAGGFGLLGHGRQLYASPRGS